MATGIPQSYSHFLLQNNIKQTDSKLQPLNKMVASRVQVLSSEIFKVGTVALVHVNMYDVSSFAAFAARKFPFQSHDF